MLKNTLTLLLALGLGLAVPTACDGKQAGSGKAARKKSTKTNTQRMLGTWSIDADKVIQNNAFFQKLPPNRRALSKAAFAEGKVVITADTITMEMVGKKQTATWNLLKDTGDTLLLETTDEKKRVQKLELTFHGDDELVGKGTELTLYLKRKK